MASISPATLLSFLLLIVLLLSPVDLAASRISLPPASSPFAGGPTPTYSSPPAPSPYSQVSSPSPSPTMDSPTESPPMPAPAPAPTNEDAMDESAHDSDVADEDGGEGGGMSGGKKVGIVFGVIVAAAAVVLAGFVYKKRRDNIRRSRYSYTSTIQL